MFKKVIYTHLGEQAETSAIVGDTVRYRIYFDRVRAAHSRRVIVDKLDKALTRVTAFNGGSYDPRTHAVTWRLDRLTRRPISFVELEATIASVGEIKNQAVIEAPRQRARLSNTVLTRTVEKPKTGWIPLGESREVGMSPISYMKDETSMGLTVNFDISGIQISDEVVGGVTYHHFTIPERATLMKVGEPRVPITGALVEVPHGVDIDTAIVKSSFTRLKYYNVHPTQVPIPRQRRASDQTFIIDQPTYFTDTLYPGELAVIEPEDVGIVRGHRLVFLKVNPVQFNPVTLETNVYSNIEVQLQFDRPGQIEKIPDRIQSSAFEAMLQNSILNYKQPERFARGGDYQKEITGCHYLILTHPIFYNPSDANNPVVRLQNWKRRKGLITRVTDVTGIAGGNTAAAIRDYIKDAYDNWNPAPTYVLLVGDDERIPTTSGLNHPNHPPLGASTPIGTDLDYSAVDGSDYFPDLFLARLPVSTAVEAETTINKIIDYEQTPPAPATNPDFYSDASLVCLFEDVRPPSPPSPPQGNGREDGSFRIIEFSEAIRGHLEGAGYNVDRIYARSGVHPTGPEQYEDGTNLSDELTFAGNPALGIPGFPWNGGTADIRNAFTNGNFLICFNGHGGRQSWGLPRFNTADIAGLNNGNLTPVVLSFACQSGWFDNSTDAASLGTAASDDAFCEELLTHSNGGAVATIGSTRDSWENNDFMMLGACKAIWSSFKPNPSSTLPVPDMEIGSLTRMGQILNFSKIYMANVYGHNFLRESSFEMYHLFGDPEMPIWTEVPSDLAVSHPDGIGATGEQDFVVKATNKSSGDVVQSASVTLTRRVTPSGNPVDQIIETALTGPDGVVRFTITDIGDGDIDITVVAANFIPYHSVMNVEASGAILNRLDPTHGPVSQSIYVGGKNFDGNESVDIFFDGHLITTIAASGGEFGQPGSDVIIQVEATIPLGLVNVVAVGRSSIRHAVDVFRVRTANPIDIWTYSQWEPATWHLNTGLGNPIWNNPEIQLYDDSGNPVSSNNLIAGTTYTVKVNVHNDTAFQANQARIIFRWANFGIGGPFYDFNTIALDVPPGGDTAEAPFTPGGTGHLCVQAEIFHVEDIHTSNNIGQENLHVGPTSSPAKVCFEIWNQTNEPAAVFLEVRQQIPADRIGYEQLWATWVVHPDRQVLQPGEKAEACVEVDPKFADVDQGAKAEFAVTGFINGRIIGGVNLLITKA